MLYGYLADIVVVAHLGFILFAVLGGTLALRWKRCAWVHLPVVLWAVLIELIGWPCPLTPLENWLRDKGGQAGYETGFIEHYLLPVIYPGGMTRNVQIVLGVFVLAVNLTVYAWILRRWAKSRV